MSDEMDASDTVGCGVDLGVCSVPGDVVDPATQLDTPVDRATVNRLSVEAFEAHLDQLRERRMAVRQKVERAAKVKTEKADLTAYLKFEKLLKAVNKAMTKLDADVEKMEKEVHKLRVLTVEMGVDN